MRLDRRFVFGCAVVLAGAGMAGGQEPGGKSLADLVGELRSPQYGVREAATQELMRLPAERRSDIEIALAHATDEETVVRLEQVAVHLFMKAQTSSEGKIGLMGVRLSTEPVQVDPKNTTYQMSVIVWKTQPGFSAAEELEPADRLIALNGVPFPLNMSTDEFRGMINAAGGGAVLPFTVIRNGKVIEVKVRLGGLRPEDMNALEQIVQLRDQAAEGYRESLKRGVEGETLVVHVEAPANLDDRVNLDAPGTVENP